jgi:hypothetical protein
MRYHVRPPIHRNLAASKRSIVIVCAAIALVLGTTSVGASFFTLGDTPLTAPATNAILPENTTPNDERPLPTTNATQLLGVQSSVTFSPAPAARGRIGIEAGPASAAAIITQLQKTVVTETPTPPVVTEPSISTVPTPPVTTPAESTPTDPPVGETTPPPENPTPTLMPNLQANPTSPLLNSDSTSPYEPTPNPAF